MTSRGSVSKRKTGELLALDSQSGTAFGDNKNGSNPEFDWIQTVFEIFHMIWNVSVVSMQLVGEGYKLHLYFKPPQITLCHSEVCSFEMTGEKRSF